MYKRQHQLYVKTLQLNHQLANEINDLQDKNNHLQNSLKRFQQSQATKKLLHPTFVDQGKYYRQRWEDYIHLSLNDYNTKFLGGIKNIKITLSNQTDFQIDRASVKVSYYRANGDLFKTENIAFQKIPSQKTQTITAPDSKRGMSVKIQFLKIRSREMNFCWDKNKKIAAGEEDPYRCKKK